MRRLVGESAPKVERHTDDLDAYHLYLRGRHHWFSRYSGGLEKALRYFEQAAEKDPSYPLAHAGVAQAYSIFGLYGFLPPKVAFPRAKVALGRTFGGESDVAEAHTASGMVQLLFDWDWKAADEEFTRGIALDPGHELGHCWYGLFLSSVGRQREAVAAAAKAQELDPLSAYASSVMGWVLGIGREFDEALEQLQPVLDHTPDDLLAVYVAGSCYDWLSMYDKAVVQFRKAADLSHRAAFYVGLLGQTYAHAGRRSEAVSIREELRERCDHESRTAGPITLNTGIFPALIASASPATAEAVLQAMMIAFTFCFNRNCVIRPAYSPINSGDLSP